MNNPLRRPTVTSASLLTALGLAAPDEPPPPHEKAPADPVQRIAVLEKAVINLAQVVSAQSTTQATTLRELESMFTHIFIRSMTVDSVVEALSKHVASSPVAGMHMTPEGELDWGYYMRLHTDQIRAAHAFGEFFQLVNVWAKEQQERENRQELEKAVERAAMDAEWVDVGATDPPKPGDMISSRLVTV